MTTVTRSADEVYAQIAELTGVRAEMERKRFALIKAIRAIGAVMTDPAMNSESDDDLQKALGRAAVKLTETKSALWVEIEDVNGKIQRLTDLCQNGAFNA